MTNKTISLICTVCLYLLCIIHIMNPNDPKAIDFIGPTLLMLAVVLKR